MENICNAPPVLSHAYTPQNAELDKQIDDDIAFDKITEPDCGDMRKNCNWPYCTVANCAEDKKHEFKPRNFQEECIGRHLNNDR